MSLTIEQASKQLVEALVVFAQSFATAPAAGESEAKPKKEPKAAKEPKTEPAKVEGPSAKQVADAVLDLANDKGRDIAVGILGKFKAGRVSELKASDYAEVLKLVEEAKAAPAVVANDSLV